MIRAIFFATIIALVAICSRESGAETTETQLIDHPAIADDTVESVAEMIETIADLATSNLTSQLMVHPAMATDTQLERLHAPVETAANAIRTVSHFALRVMNVVDYRLVLAAFVTMVAIFSYTEGAINTGVVNPIEARYYKMRRNASIAALVHQIILIVRFIHDYYRDRF